MKNLLACAALLATTVSAFAAPAEMDKPLPMSGGLTIACTGVGSAKDDPQWAAWPVRIEFSNGGAQYLSGAHVVIGKGGETLADLDCAGPWVLVKGPAGSYHVTGTMDFGQARPETTTFSIDGGHGQKRVELQYRDFQPNQ